MLNEINIMQFDTYLATAFLFHTLFMFAFLTESNDYIAHSTTQTQLLFTVVSDAC